MRRRRLLVLSAILSFLTSACRRPVEETRFLNFDPESSARALLSGWSGWEKTPEGDSFAWCQAREGRLSVVSRADGDRLLRFRCWPFLYPGGSPQAVTLYVNETKIETTTLADGPHVYSYLTPQAAWRDGTNEIRLEFAFAEAPKDRLPGAADIRTLSAAFDWLEIVPPLKFQPKR